MVNELDTCAAFVPHDLTRGNVDDDAKTLEMGAIIKKVHVHGDKATANDYMDVNRK